MENLTDALIVTVIGMGIIFLVLTLILVVIITLNKIFPYRKKPSGAMAASTDETQIVAVIQSAITMYLRQRKS